MNVEEIIRNLLEEISKVQNKRIVLFLSGGSVNAEELLKALTEFELVNYDIIMTDNAEAILGDTTISTINGNIIRSYKELEPTLKRADLILIPILTRNTLSKVVLGISDNLVTTGIAWSLMMNKPIIAVKDSYHPLNAVTINNDLSKNGAYNDMLLDYESKLEHFGVKVVDLSEFKQEVQAGIASKSINQVNKESMKPKRRETVVNIKSPILTLTDLKKYQNQEVCVSKSTIITPLAHDYIQANELKLRRE